MMSSACFTELNELKSSRKIDSDGDRHDDGETFHRALLVFELSAPSHDIAGRKLYGVVDLRFRFLHESADVAAGDVAFDDDAALRHFAADLRRSFAHFNFCDLAERDQRALLAMESESRESARHRCELIREIARPGRKLSDLHKLCSLPSRRWRSR